VDYVQTGGARMTGVSDSGKDPVMAGFSVNIPLWWSKYRAGVREAENRYAATQQDRQDRANRLSTDLRLALFKFQDAERKIALYRDALIPKADQNLKVIQRSFEAGKSDFLSLIDAERILLEFQLTYERAVADREQGLATMEKLTGGESPVLAPTNEGKP
jgi:outer membrane protein TolC